MSSFRAPQNLSNRRAFETGEAVFAVEVLEEQAASLARMGGKVEAALAALAAHEGEGRAQVLAKASDAVWCFLVQREVMGLRDRARVIADYGIPREVLVRLGAR